MRKVVVWHASPEANIQRFVGRYSPKHKDRGIFVSPSMRAIVNSWAPYVSRKKTKVPKSRRGPDYRPVSQETGTYDNVTIYKIAVPEEVLREAEAIHDARKEEARALDKENFFGAWGWDEEVFIPDRFLPYLKIVGRETLQSREFYTSKRRSPDESYLDYPDLAKQSRRVNPAAEVYLRYYPEVRDLSLKGKLSPESKTILNRALREIGNLLLDVDYQKRTKGFPRETAFGARDWAILRTNEALIKQEIEKGLRSDLIRLAYTKPEMRSHLLPLLFG